ncbi:MAG: CinA family protein [Bacilli bacterium]|nr:CinA family protein [Bacilli bacterium]
MENATKLVRLLTKHHLTIGSVESLTAGLFVATLAEVPGASKVVRGGLVTYQSNFKTALLGIKSTTIKKYGVVSKEIATAMAQEGEKLLKTDLVVTCTGNAGPSKEPGGAPVGGVHIAILCKPKRGLIKNIYHVYHGSRNTIRAKVVTTMIEETLKIVRQLKK